MTKPRVASTTRPMVFPPELWIMIMEVAPTATLIALSSTNRLLYNLCLIPLARHGAEYSMGWACHRPPVRSRSISKLCESCDYPDRMPVLFAIRKGYPELLERFLLNGYSVRHRIPHCRQGFRSALHEAVTIPVSNAKARIMQLLINSGSDLEYAISPRRTPLIYGAKNGMDSTTAKWLLDHNPRVRKQIHRALGAACHTDNLELVKFFVERGAKVNYGCPRRPTPLYKTLAGLLGNNTEQIVALLLQNGASPHYIATSHRSPLVFLLSAVPVGKVSEELRIRVVRLMVQAYGSIERFRELRLLHDNDALGALEKNNAHSESLPYHDAFIIEDSGKRLEALNLLIYTPPVPELNKKNEMGHTIMHLAAMYGDVSTVEKLKMICVNMNIRDCYKRTPLHLAADRHRTKVLLKIAYGPQWDHARAVDE
ncbi:ankyrin repeat-containing domain protein [Pyronema omphalodes]|nr:ankyrin repeat-containing domain protein [Pyronema omphalodes]